MGAHIMLNDIQQTHLRASARALLCVCILCESTVSGFATLIRVFHANQLSMASPRGIGFADEAEKASNFIISGEGCGKTTCDTGVSGVCEKE